jgi:hypothetical protein
MATRRQANPAMNQKLIEAIDLALAGKWAEAHGIVQQFEGSHRSQDTIGRNPPRCGLSHDMKTKQTLAS